MPAEAGCTTPGAAGLRLADVFVERRKGPGLITTTFGKRRRVPAGATAAVEAAGGLFLGVSGETVSGLVGGLAVPTDAGADARGEGAGGEFFTGTEVRGAWVGDICSATTSPAETARLVEYRGTAGKALGAITASGFRTPRVVRGCVGTSLSSGEPAGAALSGDTAAYLSADPSRRTSQLKHRPTNSARIPTIHTARPRHHGDSVSSAKENRGGGENKCASGSRLARVRTGSWVSAAKMAGKTTGSMF
jgi:hypothetical protein